MHPNGHISPGPHAIVIGGGPAGSTAATIMAQHGLRVRLLERERFPRFHIGESLMPETYWTLRRLGLLDRLKASHFVKKYSVQFVTDTGRESQPFYFFQNNPHECSQTWQVVRSEFDALLLENARSHGVDVRVGSRVLDVLFEGERAVGVRVQDEAGQVGEMRADVIVDASGQSSVIANRLRLRQPDPVLKKASIWTYYQGAHREPGLDEGATLVLQTEGKNGWFWYIPLPNDIVSVGVVSSIDYLFNGRSGNHETIYHEELAKCSAAKRRVEGGRRATGFFATKDFSYRSSRVAGDGWVLVGDAFGFLDPIYSSGVFLALKSGELAADAVAEGLAIGDLSGAQLGKWGPDFIRGMDRMKRLVYLFYEGFSFGQFVKKHPHLQRHITDLLIGDLFKDSVDEVWDPMDELQRQMHAQMSIA
jgi:flavin-dependent dehydrogenase